MNDRAALTAQREKTPLIPVLAVVGVGLIGGSFAAAMRQAGEVGRIVGVDRNVRSLQRACELGLIDQIVEAGEAAQADCVLFATPVRALGGLLAQMAPMLREATVLTDAGSTKAEVARVVRATLGARAAQFVPGHPIAGAEKTGPEAASPALYQDRTVILTPLAESSKRAIWLVRQAWQLCGARIVHMETASHDSVFAAVSHLPHLLAAVYMSQVAGGAGAATRLALAGSGFRDFTRIAAGSPEMWRDIFLSNRSALLTELAALRAALDRAQQALDLNDEPGLQALLEQAAQARRNWPTPGAS